MVHFILLITQTMFASQVDLKNYDVLEIDQYKKVMSQKINSAVSPYHTCTTLTGEVLGPENSRFSQCLDAVRDGRRQNSSNSLSDTQQGPVESFRVEGKIN